MSKIFKFDGLSFIANIEWHSTLRQKANRYRLGRICVAEMDRRVAFLEDSSCDGLPLLADYVGQSIESSRRALVVLRDDEGKQYFVGDFVNGSININTDLIVGEERLETIVDSKLSEMGYASPDIIVSDGLDLPILKGFQKKVFYGDESVFERVHRAEIIGISWASAAGVLAVIGVLAFLILGVPYFTRPGNVLDRIDAPIYYGTKKETDYFSLDWEEFTYGCLGGLQRSFPRVAGWEPGESGCYINGMSDPDIASKIKLEDGSGVAWVRLTKTGSGNSILASALLERIASDFGFALSNIDDSGAFLYWRFPIKYKPFTPLNREQAAQQNITNLSQFVEFRYGFELQNNTPSGDGRNSYVDATVALTVQEFFRRLELNGPVEIDKLRIERSGNVQARFIYRKARKQETRTVSAISN